MNFHEKLNKASAKLFQDYSGDNLEEIKKAYYLGCKYFQTIDPKSHQYVYEYENPECKFVSDFKNIFSKWNYTENSKKLLSKIVPTGKLINFSHFKKERKTNELVIEDSKLLYFAGVLNIDLQQDMNLDNYFSEDLSDVLEIAYWRETIIDSWSEDAPEKQKLRYSYLNHNKEYYQSSIDFASYRQGKLLRLDSKFHFSNPNNQKIQSFYNYNLLDIQEGLLAKPTDYSVWLETFWRWWYYLTEQFGTFDKRTLSVNEFTLAKKYNTCFPWIVAIQEIERLHPNLWPFPQIPFVKVLGQLSFDKLEYRYLVLRQMFEQWTGQQTFPKDFSDSTSIEPHCLVVNYCRKHKIKPINYSKFDVKKFNQRMKFEKSVMKNRASLLNLVKYTRNPPSSIESL